VLAEKFSGERGQKEQTPRPRNSTNKLQLHFISGWLEGALGMHPWLTSRERCTKSPA